MKIKDILNLISIRDFSGFLGTSDKKGIGGRILNRVLDTHCHPEFISGSHEEQAGCQGKKNKESLIEMPKLVQDDREVVGLKGCHYLREIPKRVRNDCHLYKKVALSESGRSMVEMLGVLAVIGVLSVDGITGYRYAMNKYQANQIANELNFVNMQIATTLLKPHTGEYELSIGNSYDSKRLTSIDYPFYFGCGSNPSPSFIYPCKNNEREYYEIIENISQSICQQLAQMTQSLPFLVEQRINGINNYTNIPCRKEDNRMVLLFKADKYEAESYESTGRIYSTYGDQCENDSDCPSYWPICDPTHHQCIGCLDDSDCRLNSDALICHIFDENKRGQCYGNCRIDKDCANKPETPICNGDSCVQCTTNEHCADKPETPICKWNRCVASA